MQVNGYFNYFRYLNRNWDLRIALFVIAHEIRGELKYGLNTIGIDDLSSVRENNIDTSHATMYMPLNYFMLETLMKRIVRFPDNQGFLDMGCGRGRVVSVAAHYHFTNITGLDFSVQLCKDAIRNTERQKKKFPGITIDIINEEASHFEIPGFVNTLFFFNPFDADIMGCVLNNLLKSLEKKPRTFRVIYANPQYKYLFLEKGFVEVYQFRKLVYLEASILEKKETNPSFLDRMGVFLQEQIQTG